MTGMVKCHMAAAGEPMAAQKARRRPLISALVLWGLMALLFWGCATSRGFGQDVQSVGRNIEKSAK